MDELQWPLSVLSRAIEYKNLTGASQHIGLSQPQLSRIIAKLEAELNLTLLDKASPRNTTWTPVARQLAEIYLKSTRSLTHSILELQDQDKPSHISIGTLEGLKSLAMNFAHEVLEQTTVSSLHLDVFDLNEIEAKFLSGELDLIFSSRVPGKKKLKYQKRIGSQGFEVYETESPYRIFSPYEFDQKKAPRPNRGEKHIISNSLNIRRKWIDEWGGSGQLPGPVLPGVESGGTPVMAVANDFLNASLWDLVEEVEDT